MFFLGNTALTMIKPRNYSELQGACAAQQPSARA
jgi:hypothetical protein